MLKKGALDPIGDYVWRKAKNKSDQVKQTFLKGMETLFIRWGALIFILGVLLGRAVLLSELFPFALPFFAVVYAWQKEKSVLAAAGVIVGTFSGAILHGAFILLALLLFVLSYEWLSRKKWLPYAWVVPFTVFFATISARLAVIWLEEGTISSYSGTMSGIEAGISVILTMIFLQSIPLLMTNKRKKPLKNEEIICLIILLASVMTGAIGWVIYGLQAEHMLARYLVLVFAYAGGALLGASAGVIAGLVLSLATVANLYQMSLLAFAGLLGGLLKDGKKFGVSVGLLIGTALIALYGDGLNGASLPFMESLVAIGLFILTPKSVFLYIEKYIPGTFEYANEQQKQMKKMRDITAQKVEQFSQLFQALSKSFAFQTEEREKEREEEEVDEILSKITEKTCQTCFRKEKCWVNLFDDTYDQMAQMLDEIETRGKLSTRMRNRWKAHCHYDQQMIKMMKEELREAEARSMIVKHAQESRKLVAAQLDGVSKVMDDFVKEIHREKEAHFWQEEQIHDALSEAGLHIGHIDIYRLEEGNVEIEMSVLADIGREQAEKIIAPMLSDILKEHIIVLKEEPYEDRKEYTLITFSSAKTYQVDIGTTAVAKGGGWISGDSHAAVDIGKGKFAVAISDGMGSGEKAHEESSAALYILKTILASGMDEEMAIRSVNSILSLRSTEEMFSTLDLAMIDLQDASGKFIKIGSTPSFIKRGDKVIQIEANNLPFGMMEHAEVDVVNEQLKDGDLLVMMSDGIFDIQSAIENVEIWMKRMIGQMDTNDPQEMADRLLERVLRMSEGTIDDDMTIMTAKITRNLPEWKAIPVRPSISLRKKAQ